jgi:DNA repair protein RadD
VEIVLRDYQDEAIDTALSHLINIKTNPCVVIPTGGGKSIVIAELMRQFIQSFPSIRFCVVAHKKELIQQNHDKLKSVWPGADSGIYCSGLNKDDTGNQIIFASIQSIFNKAHLFKPFNLIIVDEAHRIPFSGEGQYRRFINDENQLLKSINLNNETKVLGFTATPYRLKGGYICGEGNILNEVCYEVPVSKLIKEGYLTPPVSPYTMQNQIRTDGVSISNGDFKIGELEESALSLELVTHTVDEIRRYVCKKRNEYLEKERKSIIIFAVSIKHANSIFCELAPFYKCGLVTGETSKSERDEIVRAFTNGELRFLINCMMYVEGFDATLIDCVVLCRPTRSKGLYIQMVGRGTRLHPGKEDFLVLDFGGNIDRHGPIDRLNDESNKKKKKEKKEKMVLAKFCPYCDIHQERPLQISARYCPTCDHVFIPDDRKIEREVSKSSIITVKEKPNWKDVDDVEYNYHTGKNGTDSMKIVYKCGMFIFQEWICVAHEGFPKQKAFNFLLKNMTEENFFEIKKTIRECDNDYDKIDKTIKFCQTGRLRRPIRILVDESGKYSKIINYEY